MKNKTNWTENSLIFFIYYIFIAFKLIKSVKNNKIHVKHQKHKRQMHCASSIIGTDRTVPSCYYCHRWIQNFRNSYTQTHTYKYIPTRTTKQMTEWERLRPALHTPLSVWNQSFVFTKCSLEMWIILSLLFTQCTTILGIHFDFVYLSFKCDDCVRNLTSATNLLRQMVFSCLKRRTRKESHSSFYLLEERNVSSRCFGTVKNAQFFCLLIKKRIQWILLK